MIGSSAQRGYGQRWRRLRLFVLARDRWVCHYCGGPARAVDHVVPKIEGGTDHPANLVAACGACNSRRSLAWVLAHRGKATGGTGGGGSSPRARGGIVRAEGRPRFFGSDRSPVTSSQDHGLSPAGSPPVGVLVPRRPDAG